MAAETANPHYQELRKIELGCYPDGLLQQVVEIRDIPVTPVGRWGTLFNDRGHR